MSNEDEQRPSYHEVAAAIRMAESYRQSYAEDDDQILEADARDVVILADEVLRLRSCIRELRAENGAFIGGGSND